MNSNQAMIIEQTNTNMAINNYNNTQTLISNANESCQNSRRSAFKPVRTKSEEIINQ